MKFIKLLIHNLNALWTQHWLAILLIAWGTWLRFDHLQTHAIIFGDSARDLLVAAESVQTRTLPLLGIPSSVPRFKQGPLTIWLNMLIYPFAGHNLLPYSLIYAGIGALTLVFLYEFCLVWANKKTGLIALSLLVASPMAVAHSRMTYHITPIPLALIAYLWLIMRLVQKKPHALFWAAFIFGMLFMFELSLLPLIILIAFGWWNSGEIQSMLAHQKKLGIKTQLIKRIVELLGGLLLGLLPEVIFDFTNKFQQLGGYLVWLGYRLIAAVVPSQHTFSPGKIQHTLSAYWEIASRIWTLQPDWTATLGWGLILISVGICGWQIQQKKSAKLSTVVLVALGAISVGYFWHGSPSEAYFPPYLILLPLVVGSAAAAIINKFESSQWLISGLIMCLIAAQTWQIYQGNFQVSTTQTFSYGPSVLEHQQILATLALNTGPEIKLTSPDKLSEFATYFHAFKWLAPLNGLSISPSGTEVVIVPNQLVSHTTPTRITGQGIIRSQRFPSLTIYYAQTAANQ